MPQVIDDWKIEVLTLLGEKVAAAEANTNASGSPMNRNRVRDPNTVLPQVTMPGNPPPQGRFGKFLANQLFGTSEERHDRDDPTTRENKQKLLEMEMNGEAAPVRIQMADRQLCGNFYSAKGHNLKSEDHKPDLKRPVVLLLTGSGGSAENQGFDVASLYAAGGASVLSVNYGGYGDSSDTPVSEQSLNQDAQAMLEYLVGLGYDPDNIVLHGFSMGASVAGQLGGAYESREVRFRGIVQDRPMTSAYDGVVGRMGQLGKLAELAGKVTEDKLGGMSGKDGMLATSPETRKVVTSDEGRFADAGDRLRDALAKEGHTVAGQRTDTGHLDHAAMIRTNKDALLDLVRFEKDGSPTPQPIDMEVIFLETTTGIINDARELFPMINQAREEKSADKLTEAMQAIAAVETQIDQVDSTGIGATKRFKTDMDKLQMWRTKLETYRKSVIEAIKELTGENPFAEDELMRLAPGITRLTDQFDAAGGAKEENKALEDEVLKMAGHCGALLKEVKQLPQFKKAQPDFFVKLDALLNARKAIVASRVERDRLLKEAGVALVSFAKQPDLTENATAALRQEMAADFQKLEAQDEDVSAKRGLGGKFKSKDAGFKKAVVQPVAAILPKIRNLMEQGTKIDSQTLPELDGVQAALQSALTLYSDKLNRTDQRKHPKDFAQRQKKVDAIQSRIQGLNGLIDKANNQASKINAKLEQMKPACLQALEDGKVRENLATLVNSVSQDATQVTGDAASDQKAKERAQTNTKLAAKVFENADHFQRDALLRSKYEPKALMKVLETAEGNFEDDATTTLLDEFADDPAYLEALANAAIENNFENSPEGTKPLRGNSIESKFIMRICDTPEMRQVSDEILGDVKAEVKGKNWPARCPDSIEETDSQDVKDAKTQERLAWDRSVTELIDVFRTVFAKILAKPIPTAVSRVCETLYATAMKKYGDEDEALRYVGGHVFLRIINPALMSAKYASPGDQRNAVRMSKVIQNLANGTAIKDNGYERLNDLIDELSPQVDAYLRGIVEVGDTDKKDVTVQELAESALMSGDAINGFFAEPTADDPLGTIPSQPLSVLGRAIAKVRTQRNLDYDWNQLLSLKETNPKAFWRNVRDERRIVVEMVIDEA